jgi:flagellar basal-body rod protein FlgB
MELTGTLNSQLVRYLDLNTREIQLTAANMANIDTPGYRAMGMDFEAEMKQAMKSIDMGTALNDPRVKQVDGLIVRPDGNDVSMDRESLNLAEAQLRFKVGVALLKNQFSEMMNVIHADAK